MILIAAQLGGQSPAAGVRRSVEAIPIGGKLTVYMPDGREYYGNLSSVEPETFSLREVDLKQRLTLRYDEVKRVRADYGRPGFGGRRPHPHTSRWVALAVIGGLLIAVFVAVASDKS